MRATRTRRFPRLAVALAIAVASLSGCSLANSVLKAGPAPDSGFLDEPERMAEHRERAPFNRIWVEDGFRVGDYHSLVVAPVNTNHALARSTWAKINLREFEVEDDLQGIAGEFRQTVIDAFRNAPDNHFAIVDAPDDQTLVLELAITELVPSKAFLATIGSPRGLRRSRSAFRSVSRPRSRRAVGWRSKGACASGKTGPWCHVRGPRAVQDAGRGHPVDHLVWPRARVDARLAGQLVMLANTPHEFKVEGSSASPCCPGERLRLERVVNPPRAFSSSRSHRRFAQNPAEYRENVGVAESSFQEINGEQTSWRREWNSSLQRAAAVS